MKSKSCMGFGKRKIEDCKNILRYFEAQGKYAVHICAGLCGCEHFQIPPQILLCNRISTLYLRLNFILLLFAIVFTVKVYGQSNHKIDSLVLLLNKSPEDSNKVNLLFTIGRHYEYFNSKERIAYFISALNLAKKINSDNGIKKVASALITNLFHRKMYGLSMNYCLEYLTFLEKHGAKHDLFGIYNVYGNLLAKQGQSDEASKYYHLAKAYYLQKNDLGTYATTLNNISILLTETNQLDSALLYSMSALEIFKKQNTKAAFANSVLGIAEIFLKKGDLLNAKKRAHEALDLYYDSSKNTHGIANSLMVLGQIYLTDNKPYSALLCFNKASEFVTALNFIHLKRDCAEGKSAAYSLLKKYDEAYKYHVEYKKYCDTISLDNLKGKMLEMEVKYDITKKEGELREKDFELAANSKQRNYLLVIVAVILVLFFISYRAYTQKRKANTFITEQKKLVDEKQKEILDSINYAKRIQVALLANDKLLDDNLLNHFVLFKPKDVVSGDFYWATKKADKFYLAVCDSTGHGVPGAFMSLLNINFLNEAINEKNIFEPSEVFNHVRKRLIENISQDGGRDGMDGILICIDTTLNQISYAAANNEPILIRNNKIIELPKNKMPVGKGEKTESFQLNNLELAKGDSLYLYTDGYADQFGGLKGKKFKYKQLNELLLEISVKQATEQKEILNLTFQNWKKGLEQVDDVCIIGIKL